MKRWFVLILTTVLLFCVFRVSAAEKDDRKWQDETIYSIVVDRFNNSDINNDFGVDSNDANRYHGGDFQGIIDRLDYIKDMGFTTIELSPIFDNDDDGYHGYWVKDYSQSEEHFGTIDKFKELLNEAHKREMKVIIVFPVADDSIDLLRVAQWWMNETNIDGYRIDGIEKRPVEYWQQFTRALKEIKGDIVLFGDFNSKDAKAIAPYAEGGFDSISYYPLIEELRRIFEKPGQGIQSVIDEQEQNKEIFNDPYLMPIFMDNNHTSRFTRGPVNQNQHPGPRWKLALTYLYSTPGIPIVFYGSEVALNGGEAPDNLRQMDFRTDQELVEYITKIGELRNGLPSLTRGTFEVLYDENGMVVYKREYEGETTIIALNNSSQAENVTLATQYENNKELRGLLGGDLVPIENGEFNIILDREEAEIYVIGDKSGPNIPFIALTGAVAVAFIFFLVLLKKRSKGNRA